MNKRFLSLLLASIPFAATAWADAPVRTTTVSGTTFAQETPWYYLRIGNERYRISSNRNNPFITLGGPNNMSSDENFWCFEGNETDGYKIYNMNAGTKLALAAPTQMLGDSGAESYAILKDADNPGEGYTNRWDITASSNIDGAYYIAEHGIAANKLNNRGRKLAFWNGGADAGSSISIVAQVALEKATATIDMTNGAFAATTGSTTYYKLWEGSASPNLKFSSGSFNNMKAASDGKSIEIFSGGGSCTYTLSTVKGVVASYSFKAKKDAASTADIKLVVGDRTYTITSEEQTISVGKVNTASTSFVLSGDNKGVALSDFKIEYYKTEFSQTVSTSTGSLAEKWTNQWTSSSTSPQVKLTTGKNNMKDLSGAFIIASGQDKKSVYTLSADGANLASYSFKASVAKGSVTLTPSGGTATTLTSTPQEISVTGLSASSAQFTLAGDNNNVTLTDFTVSGAITSVDTEIRHSEDQTDLLVTTGVPNYRIPAIAHAKNGNLVAVADYRYSGNDIGSGKLDLRSRISKDGGKTWGEVNTIANCDEYKKGAEGTSEFLHTGFGDPCLVADRESNKMLLLSCSGDVMFPSATKTNHQAIARFVSEDGGETWTKPVDISKQVYALFDGSSEDGAKSMFIGSGRIHQSRYTKVGQYYRLYCSVLFIAGNGTWHNYVIYSDDFGENWKLLGSPNQAPTTGDCNEPKAEELPDGSVICSSRVLGGRKYNIFRFTDTAKGEGSWGTEAYSNASNQGAIATGNSCNGEVLILPVQRKADSKKMFLVLQSVPLGPGGRTNVGIHYKGLASYSDFDTPANLSKNFEGKHQASYMGSAYSTMTLQNDHSIGFLYEESTFGNDYTIVYKNYSIETITDGKYTYDASATSADVMTDLSSITTTLSFQQGNMVGGILPESVAEVTKVVDAYKATPTTANYEAINQAIAKVKRVEEVPLQAYRMNAVRNNTAYYVTVVDNNLKAASFSESDQNQLFSLVPGSAEGTYRIYSLGAKKYVGKAPATETLYTLTSDIAEAADYRFDVNNATCGIVCTNATNASYPAFHLAGDCQRIVAWTTSAEASRFTVMPVEAEVDMYSIAFPTSEYSTIYLPRPFEMPQGIQGAKVTVEGTDLKVNYAYEAGATVPALTPLLLKGEKGTLTALPLQAKSEASASLSSESTSNTDNQLKGTLTNELTSASDASLFYHLASGVTAGQDMGFYYGAADGAAFLNKAFHAYLALPASADAKSSYIFPTTTTGIKSLSAISESQNTTLYDLQGRPVSGVAGKHGVFVTKGGKKIIR